MKYCLIKGLVQLTKVWLKSAQRLQRVGLIPLRFLCPGPSPRAAAITLARDPSPAAHRRERRKRADARVLLRLDAAAQLLNSHHSRQGRMSWNDNQWNDNNNGWQSSYRGRPARNRSSSRPRNPQGPWAACPIPSCKKLDLPIHHRSRWA